MRSDVARDLSDSADDFLRVVWPAVKGLLHPGRLEVVEAVAPDQLRRDLDILAGIDAWHMADTNGTMRGIASRVQWGKSWRTFTIRVRRPNGAMTEFEKRSRALDRPSEGWLFPALTVQAYVAVPRVGRLLGAGIIRTADLYAYARAHPTRRPRRAGNGGEEFTHWRWDELRDAGYQVGEHEGDRLVATLADWQTASVVQPGLFESLDGDPTPPTGP